ncbi:MAG TPA: hypothetical protein VN873_09110 [Candidatus Angelobacter sp.]|nr:hypothetical protein [Candidatus Angelobacter sp.]
MTHIPRIKSFHFLFCAGVVVLAVALTGCRREQIKVQEVPKDSEQTAQAPMMDQAAAQSAPVNPHAGMEDPHVGMDMDTTAQPKLGYVLPAGWKTKELQQMRVGSFDAPGKNGEKAADVSIIPLPIMPPQTELAILNMWRKSIGLPDADNVASQPVAIGSAQGKLYEVGGGKATGRIIVAELDRDGLSWYFKIMGPDAVVREQKPAFLDFVKSITFESVPAMTAAAPQSTSMDAPAGGASANVAVPADWRAIPNPAMLVAKYEIQGNGGAKAEVNVGVLAGTGGGLVANVTRWRGQLGLAAVSEEDFSKLATTVDLPEGKGTMVDFTGVDAKTGRKARLIGVIVPQANDTWFYKLMGDEQIVDQQKDAFTKFIQSAKFSNAL